MSRFPAPARLSVGLALLTLLADQASKIWMMEVLLTPDGRIDGARIVLAPFFVLTPVWNKGVSFGLLSGHAGWGAWLLGGFALIVSAMMLRWAWTAPRLRTGAALGLIVGGAIGNVVDRVRFSAVFDFIFIHFDAVPWWDFVFNVADCGVTVGAILLAIDALFDRQPTPPA